jgi:hypothetical protein
MAKDWYQQSINALQLNGKAERTQQAYTRALRMLVEFTGKRPAAISEQELDAYFLHRRNVDRWSANTMRICPERSAARAPRCCPHCGGRLRYQRAILPPRARLPMTQPSPAMRPSPAPG